VLDAHEGRHLLHAEHLEDEEQAVRVDEQLREVVEFHDVCEREGESQGLLGEGDGEEGEREERGDARLVLNHLRVRMRMADTALDVISRCRRMSQSSRLRSGGGSARRVGGHNVSTGDERRPREEQGRTARGRLAGLARVGQVLVGRDGREEELEEDDDGALEVGERLALRARVRASAARSRSPSLERRGARP